MLFKNKTYFITGASRGIGKAIALKLATHGANILIAAKSTEENPKLGGTIYSTASAIEDAGGKALAIPCDIRDESQIENAVAKCIDTFGGIDGVINNASAISLTDTIHTPSKRFDLMHQINVRGTFLVTQHCLPYLLQSQSAHILTLSPPINLHPKWVGSNIAYTLAKYNMTMMAMGWAEEFKNKIAANSLWPRTTIATAAVQNLLGGDALIQRSRKPEIVADAVFYILQKDSNYTGQQLIDEEVLKSENITNLSVYAIDNENNLQTDLFLD